MTALRPSRPRFAVTMSTRSEDGSCAVALHEAYVSLERALRRAEALATRHCTGARQPSSVPTIAVTYDGMTLGKK